MKMERRPPVIVNVGVGGWYPRGSLRLRDSARDNSPETELLQWIDAYPPRSPTHGTTPYAFKPAAISEAVRKGHRLIMWLDSAAVVRKSLRPLWRVVREEGWFFCYNGYNTGEWTSDAALEALGITRAESFGIPSVSGGCFALNLDHPVADCFFAKLKDLAAEGSSFRGAWSNDDGACSPDPRVKGHRHDQSAMSVLVHRLGMKVFSKDESFFCNEVPFDSVPDKFLISNHGM